MVEHLGDDVGKVEVEREKVDERVESVRRRVE